MRSTTILQPTARRLTLPQKTGRLTPFSLAGVRSQHAYWNCVCDCGNTGIFRLDGKSPSCGCSRKGKGATHGLSGSAIYKRWTQMRQRVNNPANTSFHKYGGRGIAVCRRWLKIENFVADMGYPPTPQHSIERKDNNKGYNPDNCKWALPPEQSRNTRRNVFLIFKGRTQILEDWAIEIGISPNTLRARIKNGWTDEEILGVAPRPCDALLEFNGKRLTASAWARELNIKEGTLTSRLRKGWTIAQSLGFADLPSRKGKRGTLLSINGKTRPLTAWAKDANLSANMVWQRITKLNWSPEKALSTNTQRRT